MVLRSLSSCRGRRTVWCRGCGRGCRVVCVGDFASRGVVGHYRRAASGHVVPQSQSSWSRRPILDTSPSHVVATHHRHHAIVIAVGGWAVVGPGERGRPHVYRQGRWKVGERCAVRWKREKKTTYIYVVPESHCSLSVKATHEGRIG
jgi:hypothetical protein